MTADAPDGFDDLMLDLYRRLPPVHITDLLLEMDAALGFTDAFTHLRTGDRAATGSDCSTSCSRRG